MLNLEDKIPGCLHFTYREALWLPRWNREATEADGLTDEILKNIVDTAKWLDAIRVFFDNPIKVHCWFRPKSYNTEVGGAKASQHLLGKAVDFDVSDMSCDDVRQRLNDANMLEKMKIRMEDAPGTNWVHLDDGIPHPNRFFKP